uniref:Uncharacterized protein n=1 Tax=Trepomonas sp. PC1 TaxID=1076344 RepID=A0A146K7S8_9EUKA|eukprot:JAP92902.1 hypothetical protein TPC1_15005 [Trepomonas sp. PC1]
MSEQDIEIYLERQKAQKIHQQSFFQEKEHTYNKKISTRPTVKIGNWVEETLYFDERQKLGLDQMTENDVNAGFLTKDFRVKNEELYCTSNREYGYTKDKIDLARTKMSVSKELKERPHRQLILTEKEKMLDQRTSHDILNKTIEKQEPQFETTTNCTYQQKEDDVPFKQINYNKEIKVHKITIKK